MRIKAFCKNNIYQDFGNHTGFRNRKSVFHHLEVGKYYEFNVEDRGHGKTQYDMIVDGSVTTHTGYSFITDVRNTHKSNDGYIDSIPDVYNFKIFFMTIPEMRDQNLNNILG